MNTPSLTKEKIDYLSAFCKKHGVPYYDVQLELIDHLATAIEEKMSSNTALSFEKALDEVYKGFGKNGFKNIIKAKQQVIERQRNSLYWSIVKKFYKMPWILVTVILPFSILLYLANSIQYNSIIYTIYESFLYIYVSMILMNVAIKLFNKKRKQKLLGQLILHPQSMIGMVYIMINFFFNRVSFSNYGSLGFNYMMILIILFCIYLIVSTYAYMKMKNKVYKEYQKNYPEAFA